MLVRKSLLRDKFNSLPNLFNTAIFSSFSFYAYFSSWFLVFQIYERIPMSKNNTSVVDAIHYK